MTNNPEYWLALNCRYGSILDASAATQQRAVMAALPEGERARVAHIPAQEHEHARIQRDIAVGLVPNITLPSTFSLYRPSLEEYRTRTPLGAAVWLAVAEKMFSLGFLAIARRAKALGYRYIYDAFMHIKEDEDDHVEHGLLTIRQFGGASLPMIRAVGARLDELNASDPVVANDIPIGLGLRPFGDMGSRMAAHLTPMMVK